MNSSALHIFGFAPLLVHSKKHTQLKETGFASTKKTSPVEQIPVRTGDVVQLAGTIKLNARDGFVVGSLFKKSEPNMPDLVSDVRILDIGHPFSFFFSEEIAEGRPTSQLLYGKLAKPSLDKTLFGLYEKGLYTTLADVWRLLKKQPTGNYGALLTNGRANLFYICRKDRVYVVTVRWVKPKTKKQKKEGLYGWVIGCDSTSNTQQQNPQKSLWQKFMAWCIVRHPKDPNCWHTGCQLFFYGTPTMEPFQSPD